MFFSFFGNNFYKKNEYILLATLNTNERKQRLKNVFLEMIINGNWKGRCFARHVCVGEEIYRIEDEKFSCVIFSLLIYWNSQDEEMSLGRTFHRNQRLMLFLNSNIVLLYDPTLNHEVTDWETNLDIFFETLILFKQTKNLSHCSSFSEKLITLCSQPAIFSSSRDPSPQWYSALPSSIVARRKIIFLSHFPLLTCSFFPSSLVDEK